MAGVVAALVRVVEAGDVIVTGLGVVVGAVVFGAAVLALRVEEVDYFEGE